MHLTSRGFTLTELLVALLLLGIIAAGIHRLLRVNQRSYEAQTLRIDVHQSIRAIASVLPAELRELDATDGDILALASDSIRIRAMRHLAFLCAPPPLGAGVGALGGLGGPLPAPAAVTTTLLVAEQPSYGLRAPAPDDSLFVYYEGDPATRADDGWVAGAVVALRRATCPPPDGRPARAITAQLGFMRGQWLRDHALPAGGPLRAYEPVTYRQYRASDGHHYIGQRVGTDLQPIAGPVTTRGLALAYFDAAGSATSDRFRVAAVEIRVRGGTSRFTDSVVTRVALRGNRRW